MKFTNKWHRIAWEFRNAPATMGSFHFHLCEAIIRADVENTNRLKSVYPELVHYVQEVEL